MNKKYALEILKNSSESIKEVLLHTWGSNIDFHTLNIIYSNLNVYIEKEEAQIV